MSGNHESAFNHESANMEVSHVYLMLSVYGAGFNVRYDDSLRCCVSSCGATEVFISSGVFVKKSFCLSKGFRVLSVLLPSLQRFNR